MLTKIDKAWVAGIVTAITGALMTMTTLDEVMVAAIGTVIGFGLTYFIPNAT